MSLRYKSFFLGIVLTSLTWAISLYLYISLSTNNINNYEHSFSGLDNASSGKNMKYKYEKTYLYEKQPKLSYQQMKKVKYKEMIRNAEWGDNGLNALPVDLSQEEKPRFEPIKLKTLARTVTSAPLLDDVGLVKSPNDQKVREDGYRKHAFNVLVSNRLSLRRELPDVRHQLCRDKIYQPQLPTTSVVVCFYNEAKTTLLRTVYSVLDRTPELLLHEIVLIDDFSDSISLGEEVASYFKNETSKVKLFRSVRREGLIRARMFGAKKSSGDVLTFLDSHCEVNVGWMEPLLSEIAANRTNVVCPIIDIINTDTFAYSASPLVRGGFNWGLHFKWDSLPPGTFNTKEDYAKPVISPTMAGGLFAIDRHYFTELGEYDSGMDVWGGENLEISFRIWMCGGSLKIVPCSRVGHVFRKRRPYGSPDGEDTMLRNSLRVAHVWMDDYKNYFLQTRYDAKRKDYGNISERVDLRNRLQCQSFDWYLKNIYPELQPPLSKEEQLKLKEKALVNGQKMTFRKRKTQKSLGQYQIKLSGSDFCIQSEDDITVKGSLLMLRTCRKILPQAWYETSIHEFTLAEMLCLDAAEEYPRLAKCHEMGGPQEWKYSTKVGAALYNLAAGLCLGVKNVKEGAIVVMEMCTRTSPTQWDLIDWIEETKNHHDTNNL